MAFGVLVVLCLAANLATSVTRKDSKLDSLMLEPFLWTTLSKEKKGILTEKAKKELLAKYMIKKKPQIKRKISVFDILEKDFEKYEASTTKLSEEISLNNYFSLHNVNVKGINKGDIRGIMSNIAPDELSRMSNELSALENVYEDIEAVGKHFEPDNNMPFNF